MIEWWWLLIVGFGCTIFGFVISALLAAGSNADKDMAAGRILSLVNMAAYKGRMDDIRREIRNYWGGVT